jgi:hypothetical protein
MSGIMRILEAIKKQIDAIAKHAETYEKSKEQAPPTPLQRVRNEVDFSEEIKRRYYSDQNKGYAVQKRTFWVLFLTLLALIINAVLIWQANKINKTYTDRAYRPFVGLDGVVAQFTPAQLTDPSQVRTMPDKDTTGLNITVRFKNYGPVPATDCYVKIVELLDGVSMLKHASGEENTPVVIFPGQTLDHTSKIWNDIYFRVQKGQNKLEVQTTIRYNGPSGSDTYCDKEEYTPQLNGFLHTGNECGK